MPKLKDQEKVFRLFEAAFRLILRTGYAGFKMSSLASEAGVATGTVYTYFENKFDLINQLFRKIKQEKMDVLYAGLNKQAPAFQQFKELWQRYFIYALHNPEKNHFIKQYELSDHLDEESRALHTSAYVYVTILLEGMQKDGLIRDVPVDVLLAYVIGGSNEVARLFFGKKLTFNQAFLDDCFSMVWSSMAKSNQPDTDD